MNAGGRGRRTDGKAAGQRDAVRERGDPGDSLDKLGQLVDGEENAAQQKKWRDQEPADQGKTGVGSLRRGERKDRRAKGEAGQDGDDNGQQSEPGMDRAKEHHDEKERTTAQREADGKPTEFACQYVEDADRCC